MSQFDPVIFLDISINEPNVKRPPLPVGEYTAVIGEITSRAWTGKTDPTKSGIALDVALSVEVPAEIQTQLGITLSNLPMKDSIMLDLTAGGTIDNSPGKNGRLRQYREATDMNKVGDTFSARKLTGMVITVKITHEVYEGEPKERISGVALRA